jgi:pSer/pThr/pTyr-binding forkhead associated (FHA) protein
MPVARSPLLTVVSGPLRGASFRLRPGSLTIGRGGDVDIAIDDRRVSRRHAAVEPAPGGAVLSDAGSTNGTWLNDQRLTGPALLRDGDRIRVGRVELRFFDPGSAPTDPVGTLRYAPPAQPGPARDPAGQRHVADSRT